MSTQQSSSSVQSEAEGKIRRLLANELSVALDPVEVEVDDGAKVHVDAVSPDRTVFAEIFARQGKLKPGQQKKVAIDTLKLLAIQRQHPGARLMLVFCDDEAAAYARGKGWLARALNAWGVEVRVIAIEKTLRDEILAAQGRQVMVNPNSDEDEATAELE